ncbi:hypothetical protein N9L68_04960 [bacterium]|nr:hypothetical protein [bacterium]
MYRNELKGHLPRWADAEVTHEEIWLVGKQRDHKDAGPANHVMRLPRWMTEITWMAHGLPLMTSVNRAGTMWVALSIERLTWFDADVAQFVQCAHAHSSIGTYNQGKPGQREAKPEYVKSRVFWAGRLRQTSRLLGRPLEWTRHYPLVWDLLLEQSQGEHGTNGFVRVLGSILAPLGHVRRQRSMMYMPGPNVHLIVYDATLIQRRTAGWRRNLPMDGLALSMAATHLA